MLVEPNYVHISKPDMMLFNFIRSLICKFYAFHSPFKVFLCYSAQILITSEPPTHDIKIKLWLEYSTHSSIPTNSLIFSK